MQIAGTCVRFSLPALLLLACSNSNSSGQEGSDAANTSTETTTSNVGGTTSNTEAAATSSASSAGAGGASSATTVTSSSGSGSVTSTASTDVGGMGGSGMGGSAMGGVGGAAGGTTSGGLQVPSVLVFSKTAGYVHQSIGAGQAALSDLAMRQGWDMDVTEDAAKFTDEGLADYNVVLFLSTTGDVLNAEQEGAFERFIQRGNGYVGVHAASDTEFDWAWYGELVGAYFKAHPDIQPASIVVEAASHPSTAHLVNPWQRTDEWYGFETNPRASVNVLLSLDEQSYNPGEGGMQGDHPIAWYHLYDGGRSFYTALGHTSESYADAAFMAHLKGGIEWAAGAVEP